MAELDGVWALRRLSGLLPPLAGMRKRIAGDRGETLLPGGLLGVPFDVRGRELRYRLLPVVDVLEPTDDERVWRGTTRVADRAVGRFELRRLS